MTEFASLFSAMEDPRAPATPAAMPDGGDAGCRAGRATSLQVG